jgi:hypothetical protein
MRAWGLLQRSRLIKDGKDECQHRREHKFHLIGLRMNLGAHFNFEFYVGNAAEVHLGLARNTLHQLQGSSESMRTNQESFRKQPYISWWFLACEYRTEAIKGAYAKPRRAPIKVRRGS